MKIAVAHKLEIVAPDAGDALPPLVLPQRGGTAVMGQTIAEFLDRSGWRFDLPTVCRINGAYFGRAEWSTTAIAANDNVEFISRPLGPGQSGGSTAKSIGAIVGMIALTALAAWVIGPTLLGSGLLAAAAKALLVGGGAMLLSTFLKPKTTKSAPAAELYSFGFSTNQARPLQAIPVGYGRRLVRPDVGAPTYSEYAGDSMIDYALFCLGCGEYDCEEFRIADTTIWTKAAGVNPSFPGITVQIVPPGEQVTLFPANVVTSSEVTGTEIGTDWIGGYVVNAAGTTARKILIDLVWPSGATMTYKGDSMPVTTGIQIQARPVGLGGAPTGPWFDLLSKGYYLNKQSQIRVTEECPVGAGRYEVRLRRTTPPVSDLVQIYPGKVSGTDTVNWTALRAHIDGPNAFAGVTMIAVRAEANASLSGVTNGQFGVISTRILPVWNGSDFVMQPTRSIAWAALDAWRNSDYSAGLDLSGVDLQAFIALDALWASLGHSFDHFFTEPRSLDDTLETILKAGRAFPAFVGDKLTIARDEPRGIPRMLFNDFNIITGSLEIDYTIADPQFADGVVGQYLDEETWRLADVTSAPGEALLAKPATVQPEGIVRRAQAAGFVRFADADHKYRRIRVTWTTGLQGKLLKRGDLVHLTSEEPETWGASHEVLSYDAATRRVRINPPAVWETGQTHYFRAQRRDGVPWGPVRVTRAGADDLLTVDATDLASEATRQGMTLWDALARADLMEPALATFSPGQPRFFPVLIEEGTPDQDGEHITLTGVVDAPEVYDIVETGVPPIPSAPLVTGSGLPVVIGIGLQVVQRATNLVLLAGWRPASGAVAYKCEISYDEGVTWLPAGESDRTAIEVIVSGAPVIHFRVAGRTSAGDFGGWSTQLAIPPSLVVERDYVTIKATREDFEPVLQRQFVTLQEMSGIADVATEGQLIAYEALGAAEAGVKQFAEAIATEQAARAALHTEVFAKFGTFGGTVGEHFDAQTTVNGQFVGQWMVRIATGGFVSGLQSITESGTGGVIVNELRVLTDRFLIGPPTGSGVTPEYLFAVGLVGGAARVGIKGSLVLDGTVSAGAIQTPSLSAISASLGVITAGELNFPAGSSGRIIFWDNSA